MKGNAKQAADNGPGGKRGHVYPKEVALGLAVVLTVALVYFGVRFLEDRPFLRNTYELVAEFESTEGLLHGDPVVLSGVRVGSVADIELKPRGQGVRVRIEIDDDIEIPEGSAVSIGGLSAFDNVQVEIEPGPDQGALVEPGALLPTRETPSLTRRVDSTLAGASQTVDRARALLAGADDDLDVILAQMRTASGEVASLVQGERDRLHRTLASLESTAAQLDRVAAHLDRFAAEGTDSLALAAAQMNALLRRLDGVVGSVERSSADLEALLGHLNTGRGTLGRLIHDPALYARLDSVAMRLDRILADFQEDPGRYLGELTLVDIF